MEFVDRMVMEDAKTRKTQDGFLVAAPRVARTGIQKYLGKEVGKPEMEVVKVYRPEEEVFNKDAFASIAHRPVTINHPNKPVTADTWKSTAVGQSDGEVVRDGIYVRVPMMVMDSRAIKLIENGDKAEISLGYTAELDWTPGQTADGEAYDAVQRNIRVNHIAVVDAARGGAALRIGDAVPIMKEKTTMGDKTILVDNVSVTLDALAADVVSNTIKRLEQRIADAEKSKDMSEEEMKKAKGACDAAIADHKKVVEQKDAEIATLKQQVADAAITPAKLDAAVAARVDVITKAKSVLGDALVVKDKSDADIRRQVVDKKLGDVAKGWSDDAVMASFNTIVATGGGSATPTGNTLADAARAFSTPSTVDFGDVEKAYADYNKTLTEAHRTAARA